MSKYSSTIQKEFAYSNYDDIDKFALRVQSEIDNCRVPEKRRIQPYIMWFGMYEGTDLHIIQNKFYLEWVTETFRNTKPYLVAQALLRLDDLNIDDDDFDVFE